MVGVKHWIVSNDPQPFGYALCVTGWFRVICNRRVS